MSRWVLDPNAVEDYAFDWTGWLEQGETITTASVTADDGGLTITNVTNANGVVSYRVSQGVLGTEQRVTCHVVSSLGRADDKTDKFVIVDR